MSFSITEECIGCGLCARICPVMAITGKRKQKHSIDGSLCIECGACGRVCAKSAVLDSVGKPVKKLKKTEWLKPAIDVEICLACENCVAACPADALSMKSEDLPLFENYAVLSSPERCVSCGWCVENCQFDAIVMRGPDENN